MSADEHNESRGRAELLEAAVAGVRWITLARGLSEVLGLATMVVLAHLIAPAEFGKFVIALIVQELALSIMGESVGNAVVQRPTVRAAHLKVAQVICLGLALALTAITLVAAAFVVPPLFGSETADLVRLIIPVYFVVAIGTVPVAILQRQLSFARIGAIQISGLVVRSLGAVALALVGLDAEALVLAALASALVATALAIAWARPPLPGLSPRAARELAGFGVPAGFAALSWIGFRNADYSIVGARLGLGATGIYWRAFQLGVEYQKKVSAILYQIAFPLLSRTASVDEMFALRLRMVRLLAVIVLPLLVGLAVLAPVLIPWLFGTRWEAAVIPTQVLAVAGAATLITDAVGTTLLAAGRPRSLLWYGWAHFGAYASAILLVAPLGVIAVSVAASCVTVVFLLIAYGVLLRDFLERPLVQLWRDLRPALVASALAAAVGIPLSAAGTALDVPPLAQVVGVVAATAPVYLLTLRRFFPASWHDLALIARRVFPAGKRREGPVDPALAGAHAPN